MSNIKQLNDSAMEAIEQALAEGDVELYNELKEEYGVVDITDLELEHNL